MGLTNFWNGLVLFILILGQVINAIFNSPTGLCLFRQETEGLDVIDFIKLEFGIPAWSDDEMNR
ncbi:hypothetical protein O9G_001449 [Rozella allomycis CSF55]|uniref:Uncharacterized protein n=1 Tax=Rozella allomycis (strain CSF55) TaxID=988480 RepID=A0A075AMS2_ROZAC|nr:hypothetical protein O9G_001449 [Rozella allomycis CSF55]|eukprot:EPZ30976.1 hypothetical protein O9G_001449 [Rozella allomycis CSF55]